MSKRMMSNALTFMAAGLFLIDVGHADGFRNPPEGMTAIGKIGGKIVFTDDATAASHNPANLADITTNSLVASFTLGYGKREFEPALGGRAESKDPWAVLPNFFAAWRVDENLTAGVALTTPYGRSTTFPKDSILRYSVPYFTQLVSVNLNPNLAMRVNDRLSVAVGIDILYADLDLRQIYPWSVAAETPGLPDGETRFQGDGAGFGYNAAVNVQVTDRQKAALTYRSSTKVDFEGSMDLTGLPGPLAAMFSARSDFETEIEFPAVVAFGYGVEVNDRLRVEANVEWVQHSLFEDLSLDAGNNTALLPASTIPADWDDNWTYGIGADYALNDTWTLRAGYLYLESPVPSQTMLPSISEEDQSVVSLGLGYASGDHRIDVAYAYGIFGGREVADNLNPGFNGSYDFEAHLLGVSYGYAF